MGTIGAGYVAIPHKGSGNSLAVSEVSSNGTNDHGKTGIGTSFGWFPKGKGGIFVDFSVFGVSTAPCGGIGWAP